MCRVLLWRSGTITWVFTVKTLKIVFCTFLNYTQRDICPEFNWSSMWRRNVNGHFLFAPVRCFRPIDFHGILQTPGQRNQASRFWYVYFQQCIRKSAWSSPDVRCPLRGAILKLLNDIMCTLILISLIFNIESSPTNFSNLCLPGHKLLMLKLMDR